MVIGKHAPNVAHDTDFRGAIKVGLDEAFTSLEEAFHDLTDPQIQAFPVVGKYNIAWTVMHCLQNLEEYACRAAGGSRCFKAEYRWDLWGAGPEQDPKPGDPFPTCSQMLHRLHVIRDAAMMLLAAKSAADLTNRSGDHPIKRNLADFYMRTIYHTMAHVRWIWLLRGALGLATGPWPEQHWA
jgi:hypothetical protein